MRTVPLQQICDIQIGKTPSRSVPEYWGGELPWVTISDFAAGRIVTTTKERITRIGAAKSGSKLIPCGTLLLSFKLSLGKRTISGCDLYTNEAIAALHILDRDAADRDYVYWALGSIDYDLLVDRAAKGKTLNKAKLKLLRLPLPSLAEQKRIAAILDADRRLAGQTPRGPRPARHVPPIHLPRHVRRSRHQFDGLGYICSSVVSRIKYGLFG